MNLEKEQEYIKSFFGNLNSNEFLEMLRDCGQNTILSTEEVYKRFFEEKFYEESSLYSNRSVYQISQRYIGYENYDKNNLKNVQGAA